jgi:hypothetical protein
MALKSFVPAGYFWWNTISNPYFLAVSVHEAMASWASSWLISKTATFLGRGSGCSIIISKTIGERYGVFAKFEKSH